MGRMSSGRHPRLLPFCDCEINAIHPPCPLAAQFRLSLFFIVARWLELATIYCSCTLGAEQSTFDRRLEPMVRRRLSYYYSLGGQEVGFRPG